MSVLTVNADSKIEAETSPTRTRIKVDTEVTLWCNATGYPPPVVYWSREDRHRKLQDGSHQYWVRSALLCRIALNLAVSPCYELTKSRTSRDF